MNTPINDLIAEAEQKLRIEQEDERKAFENTKKEIQEKEKLNAKIEELKHEIAQLEDACRNNPQLTKHLQIAIDERKGQLAGIEEDIDPKVQRHMRIEWWKRKNGENLEVFAQAIQSKTLEEFEESLEKIEASLSDIPDHKSLRRGIFTEILDRAQAVLNMKPGDFDLQRGNMLRLQKGLSESLKPGQRVEEKKKIGKLGEYGRDYYRNYNLVIDGGHESFDLLKAKEDIDGHLMRSGKRQERLSEIIRTVEEVRSRKLPLFGKQKAINQNAKRILEVVYFANDVFYLDKEKLKEIQFPENPQLADIDNVIRQIKQMKDFEDRWMEMLRQIRSKEVGNISKSAEALRDWEKFELSEEKVTRLRAML